MKKNKKRLYTFTPQTIREKTFKTYPFEGKWKDFIGLPSIDADYIIHGYPKGGKSTFCLKFAQYLSTFGKVLYIAAEEGIGATLQGKLEWLDIKSKRILFAPTKEYEDLVELIKTRFPKFIIVDSAHAMGLTVPLFHKLQKRFKKKSFIIILQSKRNDDFKGDQRWVHDTDVKIMLKAGVAHQIGRFNGESKMTIIPRKGTGLFANQIITV